MHDPITIHRARMRTLALHRMEGENLKQALTLILEGRLDFLIHQLYINESDLIRRL